MATIPDFNPLTGKFDLVTDISGCAVYHGIESAGALSFNDSTHVLTVASGTNAYWIAGVRYATSSAITCDIDDFETLTANTLYSFYFDDATGTLKCTDSTFNLRTVVPVCTVFWNGSAGAIASELHGYKRNLEWQIWAHVTIGTRYGSGLALTAPTTVNDAVLTIESGTIHDEDLISTIAQQTTMRGVYMASAGVYTWANYSLPYTGTSGSPQYLDTDTYALTAVGSSNFACYWVYATNDTGRPIHIVPTHAATSYNTIALARAETPPVLSGHNLNPEYKLIYRWIYKGDGEFQEVSDYRQSSPLPSGGASAVTASSVSFAPAGNIASTTVQAALEELDTEKANILSIASITSANSPYTVAAGISYIAANATSGAITINLPAATGTGRELTIKKTDSSANAVTPTRAGSDTIDGATSYSLTVQYASSKLVDAANATWHRSHVNQLGGDVSGIGTAVTVDKVGGKTVSLANSLTTSGNYTLTLTQTGNTNVTLPTTGTLATLAGSETLSSKTLTAPIVAVLKPASDATTAVQVTKADGTTAVLNVDTSNARVGVGTASPSATLEVAASAAVEPLRVTSSYSTGYPYFAFWGPSSRLGWAGYGNASYAFEFTNEAASAQILFKIGSTARLVVNNNGTLTASYYGQGTLKSDSSGNITSDSSDERLKTDITAYTDGLAQVLKVRPIHFKWAESTGYDTTNTYTGFSAQNVLKSMPGAVGTDARGHYCINSDALLGAAYNAIKELYEQLNVLREAGGLKPLDYTVPDITDLSKVVKHTGAVVTAEPIEKIAEPEIPQTTPEP